MSKVVSERTVELARLDARKFQDLDLTADGQRRAFVRLAGLQTLWFNTGTLCNIECRHCYLESSPRNDRLAYLTLNEVRGFLDEIAALGLPTEEIGFTGGEPFVNPDLVRMLREALERGFRVLVLTNALQPMQRPRIQTALLELGEELREKLGEKDDGRLTFRVSLDHYTPELHDLERGPGSWEVALYGLNWLSDHGFRVHVAGRTRWGEDEGEARQGYDRLFAAEGIPVDADEPSELVLFPEMDETLDVPEITVDCWEILGEHPDDVMCAWSRMVVKRKGAARPVVLACTLLPYDSQFELGASLVDAVKVVKLNHPHCARFCVLGGGACTAPANE
jgi:sulfatase maturation enzyme AslB (radical SAM superfamily)